eukprot:CAMPEP_0113937576 /NCGR_PEP_ID=MMETSP1339-20121228/4172_1 /TAXON_ID=94617 /ORGANISM="Fibrocapsa japonica" /LENGTH=78 /DNA_ID=CAMNT_0000940397 /DNA_START=123 /DNA_END=359 /DNA_ORIENTATION=- /assembly_acc=CAM_ASM_000762
MNTANSVAYSWAAFMVCGVLGGYIGMKQAEVDQAKRIEEHKKQLKWRADQMVEVQKRREKLKRAEEARESISTKSSES